MKELELFSDDTELKTMTVKEVSSILNVTPEAIKKHIRKLFPTLITNGKTTYLTQVHVADIKKNMIPTTAVVGASTEAEMVEKTIEVMGWLKSKYEEAQKQIVILKPKAEKYDSFISSTGTIDMREVAHILNIKNVGRNNLMEILRRQGILSKNNHPYQNLIRLGYFKEIPVETYVGIKCKPVAYTRGVSFIKKAVDNFFEEGGEL